MGVEGVRSVLGTEGPWWTCFGLVECVVRGPEARVHRWRGRGEDFRRKPVSEEAMWFRSDVSELDLGLFLFVGCWIHMGRIC